MVEPEKHQRSDKPLKGVFLSLTAVMCFAAMSTLVKQATENTPTGQIVFFRSLFALVPALLFAVYRGDPGRAFHTRRLCGHLVRAGIGVTAMFLTFAALAYLPLAEAIAIGYATPLIMVFLAAFFLKEIVRHYRWSAVAVGFAGIGIILVPMFDGEVSRNYTIGAMIALGAATLSACAAIQVRQLVDSESSITIVLYFSLFSSLAALLTIPFGWAALDLKQTLVLITAGLLGGIAQLLHTQSFRFADASLVAVFQYTSMIWAVAFGYLVFSEIPEVTTWAGAAVVISAGVFVIIREHRLGMHRRRKSPPAG